ncbi:dTDP-glucose 4,6-dehydratase [hydrothermal vent metagenome]|uniref:dTDP-glucose 4,6-dehydratase n=1 Tax=hydrothermal vent metagenome TaxID=652676 RepID=A0A3B0RZF9_9ZZZZ
MKTALVTGGAGFIGSALCRHLVLQSGIRVVNVDKLTYAASLDSLAEIAGHPNYEFVQADICDQSAMTDLLSKYQPEVIYHLAAETHVDRSITGAADFINTNVMGTYVLLEASLRYWKALANPYQDRLRFLQVSTDEVYGSLGAEGLFHETTAYDPSSPYSASKAAADHLVLAWQRTYGFPAVISNCSNNYGPCQFPEKLIPLMVLSALHGKPLPIYGDGSQVRDWLYVDDHARALELIANKGRIGRTYNVGGNNERTNLQVVERICQILDKLKPGKTPYNQQITYVTDRPGHDQRYAIDASRLQSELGWKALDDFDSGMEKTIAWYLDNQQWWQPLVQKGSVGERLGLETKPAS